MKTVLSDEDIQKMIDEVTSMKGVRLVREEIFDSRMKVCGECEKFLYGSTCGVCGCVMQVRARLAEGRCPKKKW